MYRCLHRITRTYGWRTMSKVTLYNGIQQRNFPFSKNHHPCIVHFVKTSFFHFNPLKIALWTDREKYWQRKFWSWRVPRTFMWGQIWADLHGCMGEGRLSIRPYLRIIETWDWFTEKRSKLNRNIRSRIDSHDVWLVLDFKYCWRGGIIDPIGVNANWVPHCLQ